MEHSDHDIRILVEESAKGNTESCTQLYTVLVSRVFAYVRSRTATHEQATDVTQDVFVDFFLTLSRFTYESNAQFYAYLFLITRRKLIRLYESSKRRGEIAPFDEECMPPTKEGSSELTYDVTQALRTLDPITQEIVVLHHWSRYTFGEIALFLNMTETAVRVRHHRALTSLRIKLAL